MGEQAWDRKRERVLLGERSVWSILLFDFGIKFVRVKADWEMANEALTE